VSIVSLVHGVVLFGSFAILWFLSLFCLLPVGLGSERDPDSGAPLSPMLGRKALIATAIAVVLWLVFYLLIAFKILDL
jgi:predicted secreted protein